MKILSIETSCDETGISIIEVKGGARSPSFAVLADMVSSQADMHAPYGGVYPSLAKREHLKNLPIILEKVLRRAGLSREGSLGRSDGDGQRKSSGEFFRADSARESSPVDLIAVTYGPGLEPALWTGITFAQELAKKWEVPVIPVNHMEGHFFSVFTNGKKKFKISKTKDPILALLVSGGHTELILEEKPGKYKIIGETLDDAVGEAFDKVARMLGLSYPGGPQISRLAEQARKGGKRNETGLRKGVVYGSLGRSDGDGQRKFSAENFCAERNNTLSKPVLLPRPMLKSGDFNFSYSGLKTAVLYLLRDLGKIDDDMRARISMEFENAAIEPLVRKTEKAIEKYKIKTLIVAGGVSANRHLRNEIKKITRGKVKLLFPSHDLTGDNSLMIGIAGYLNFMRNKKKVPRVGSLKAVGNLRL